MSSTTTIKDVTQSLRNLLVKANTSTAACPLTTSLNSSIDNDMIRVGIKDSHENMAIPDTRYPTIIVEAENQNNAFRQLGNTSSRDKTFNWDIVAMTKYGQGTGGELIARENSDLELMQLVSNIEQIIGQNISLSNTVAWARVDNIEFERDKQQTYQGSALISVVAMVRD